ncbi:hypothetical protein BG006_009367 [Podila minutissima]|uniref:Uncharacterized protein n=1 Tax=Podila minutissima TaxID=64525 RepID=A0A9P5SRH7_9FUNG|nr:hypothetical protein BG006_009367 [Podila minutissima]
MHSTRNILRAISTFARGAPSLARASSHSLHSARLFIPQTKTLTTSRAFSTTSSSSSNVRRHLPAAAVALILGGLSLTGYGLWQFYTSGVNAFPEPIRNDLRKALYYQNYGNDCDKAVGYYRKALSAAMVHPDLRVDGPEVTGIMIQLGTMFQDMGRNKDAIDVLVMAFECLVHDADQSQSQEQEQHGPCVMDGPTRLKTVGIAQKLGDLYHAIRQDQQAERYYLWSVEQLLKNHDERVQAGDQSQERLENARDQEAMKKQFNFDKLPSWMTKTDLGASLEALGGFYTSKNVYSNALPLYMRALSLIDQDSCHAAVLMCNISDALAGMDNLEEATGWAERGLKVGMASSGQECDEGCGVILYNLGMLHEMRGNPLKAQDYYKQSKQHGLKTGFNQCVVESNKAMKRMKESNEGTQS